MRPLYRRTDGGLIGDACRLTGRALSATRGRVYSLAVRVHYRIYFGSDDSPSMRAAVHMLRQAVRTAPLSPVPAPLCTADCEVVDGDADCTCLTVAEVRERVESRLTEFPIEMVPAPFTGTPYRPDPED